MLNELTELLDYFNETYVSGTYRMIQPPPNQDRVNPPMHMRRVPPMFHPVIWNVRDITINEEDRTNNICKAWNIGYQKLVGHKHPSFWTSIESIRKDEALASASIIQDQTGNPPAKRVRRKTKQLQRRLKNLCLNISEGRKILQECLRGIGYTIQFS